MATANPTNPTNPDSSTTNDPGEDDDDCVEVKHKGKGIAKEGGKLSFAEILHKP